MDWSRARSQIRMAVWEWLWLAQRAPPGGEEWVPVNQAEAGFVGEMARDLGIQESAAYANLRLLEASGWIRRRRAEHGTSIELRRQLQDSKIPGIQENRNPGIRESAPVSSQGPNALSSLSPDPKVSGKPLSKRKTKDIPPDGGAPPAPMFSPEAHQLVNALHNFLDVRGALPPTPKAKESWRMSQLHYAQKRCLDPAGGKTLAQWLACLEWAGAQTYWAKQVANLPRLAAAWSEWQLQTGPAAQVRPGPDGRRPSNVILRRGERKDAAYYDQFTKHPKPPQEGQSP